MIIISTLKQKRGFHVSYANGRKHGYRSGVCVVAPGRNTIHKDIYEDIKDDKLFKFFVKDNSFTIQGDDKEAKEAEKQAQAEAKRIADAKAKVQAEAAKANAAEMAQLKKDLKGQTVGGQVITGNHLNGKSLDSLREMYEQATK
jgi:hypothetical protein